jgi:hypothetical protein
VEGEGVRKIKESFVSLSQITQCFASQVAFCFLGYHRVCSFQNKKLSTAKIKTKNQEIFEKGVYLYYNLINIVNWNIMFKSRLIRYLRVFSGYESKV